MKSSLICALLLALPVFAQTEDGAEKKKPRGGWWGDLFAERTVELSRLLDRPEKLRGHTVSFVVQLRGRGRIDNPFHTRFETETYFSLDVWGDDGELWVREVYERPFRYLFVKRGSEVARPLAAAPEYSRWVLTGEVAEVVKGMPWIDIGSARKLATRLDEPSLVNIVKGYMLRDLKRWDAAASAFHAADGVTLPRPVRAMIAREEAKALVRGGKMTLAVNRLEAAVRVVGEDPRSAALLKAWRARLERAPSRHRPPKPSPKPGPVNKSR
ncbi:MAG: hypothetical protein HRU14_03535 [Planctomycetes bacterium]|nr:hypothetical protein [Planctomycetota bacterium]